MEMERFTLPQQIHRITTKTKELDLSKQELESLKAKLNKIETNEWWEDQVRNTLKMAREGEELVIVPDDLVSSSFTSKIEIKENIKEKPNYQKWWELFVY